MKPTATKLKPGWRVLFALFMLLSGVSAQTVNLTLPEPVACGMTCCLQDGVCCCARSHPDSFSSKSSEVKVVAATITSSCPEQCAKILTGSSHHSTIKARVSQSLFVAIVAQAVYAHASHFARDVLIDAASSPRAPPTILS